MGEGDQGPRVCWDWGHSLEELESPQKRDRDGPGSAPLVRGRSLSGEEEKVLGVPGREQGPNARMTVTMRRGWGRTSGARERAWDLGLGWTLGEEEVIGVRTA